MRLLTGECRQKEDWRIGSILFETEANRIPITKYNHIKQFTTHKNQRNYYMNMSQALFFIAENGFQDLELFEPKEVLENNGIECKITSTTDHCQGKLGAIVMTDLSLDEVKVDEYDCFILVGGPGAPAMSKVPEIINILKEAHSKQKLICAICIAPTILAEHGFLKDKKATVFPSGSDILIKNGAKYTSKSVEVDDTNKNHIFITADGPKSATAFGEKIVEYLNK